MQAIDYFEQSLSRSPGYAPAYGGGKALIYSGLGDRAQTLVWLRKAVEERSHWLVWIGLDPRFNALRSDAKFQALVRRVFPN